ncbi:MAG: hypothetical protein OXH86_01580 [Acidimicrobiaceae bacterium]|nr:hypothetical protein [Acidimicrobiaceae bacterium]
MEFAVRQGLNKGPVEPAEPGEMVELPVGFACHVGNIGIKDGTDDVMVLAADRVAAAAGVFTKSLFSGASVRRSQVNIADG